MKKILVLCILGLALPSLVFAALVPYYDPYMTGDVFSSPSLLIETSQSRSMPSRRSTICHIRPILPGSLPSMETT